MLHEVSELTFGERRSVVAWALGPPLRVQPSKYRSTQAPVAPVPQGRVLRRRAEAQMFSLILADGSTSKSGLAIGCNGYGSA